MRRNDDITANDRSSYSHDAFPTPVTDSSRHGAAAISRKNTEKHNYQYRRGPETVAMTQIAHSINCVQRTPCTHDQ